MIITHTITNPPYSADKLNSCSQIDALLTNCHNYTTKHPDTNGLISNMQINTNISNSQACNVADNPPTPLSLSHTHTDTHAHSYT